MPEGHTLHRLARDHTKWFAGQNLKVHSPQGRFAAGAKRLSGRKLVAAEAYGKHLIYVFDDRLLHVHLGLYGKFRLHRNPPPAPRGAVRVRMVGDERSFDLNGPNHCELLSRAELVQLQARLGPDPLRPDANPERAWDKIRRSRAAIGTLLLNQSVIAGIGNIFRAEVLYLLGIHPDRIGQRIASEEFQRIWELTVKLMRTGVQYNRIITVEREPGGKPLSKLNARERLNIYKRPTCPGCGGDVRCWELGNRTVYACDHCQV